MSVGLDEFKAHIIRKLNDQKSRKVELATFRLLNPASSQWTELEAAEIQASIPELEGVLQYIKDFENEHVEHS